MGKSLKKVISFSILSMVVFLTGLIGLIFFPQSLFANKFEHGKFNIYYDHQIDSKTAAEILDQTYAIIQKSELFHSKKQFDIYLSHGNFMDLIENLQGKGPYARATAGNIFIKIPTSFHEETFQYGKNLVKMPELLAHEIIHNLQAYHYGLWNFSPWKHPPMWKVEGYPEYISRVSILDKKDYDLKKEVRQLKAELSESANGLVKITTDYYAPAVYYKGRLMIEYLMQIEHLNYHEILEDQRSEEEVYKTLLDWAEK